MSAADLKELAAVTASLNPELTNLSLEHLRLRRSAKWRFFDEDVLPAFVAEMDFPLAPPVKIALAEAVELDDTGYGYPAALGLAEVYTDFAATRFGWEIDPARVSPAPDVVNALTSLLRKIAKPGDRVVINTPVYHPFFAVIEEIGCEVAEAPLVDGEIDVDAVDAEFRAGAIALILCSPHNPTGTLPTEGQLKTLAAAAAQHGAWVLSDEIHSPLTLPGARHVPFLDVSEEAREHGIALVSASKAFNLAGLHCAQFVTASERAQAVVEGLPFAATHAGHFGALASVAAYRDGAPWLDDVIAVIDHNRQLLADLLAEKLPEVGYTPPRAGYLTWLDLRAFDLGDDPTEALLERGRVALNPGPTFGPQGKGHARLNIGTSPALVEEAVKRIGKAVGRG
ncbi:MAG TPA: aminotransferase class I/II-fold pyridoxal phosphate-dependent enzyme [Solirubrobacterales bacterium]|nr:aminotransferase class I/II-fold pyridoxal phosphate-dependent enzyme [Solirubrobacterales bacterium]